MVLVSLGDLVVLVVFFIGINILYVFVLNRCIFKIIDCDVSTKDNNPLVKIKNWCIRAWDKIKNSCTGVYDIIKFLFSCVWDRVKYLFSFLFSLINFDYTASKYSKECIKSKCDKVGEDRTTKKNKVKKYIKDKNEWNLRGSIAVFAFLIFVLTRYEQGVAPYDVKNNIKLPSLYIFLSVRFTSRALEIITAFYIDIIERNENSSGLDSNDRFKLAVNSLCEIIIRCAAIYLLLHILNYGEIENVISNTFSSIYISTINSINFVSMYSSEYIFGGEDKSIFAHIFGCKNEFMDAYNFIGRSVVVLQGVASFVLIILSFAQYLSGIKDGAKAQGQGQGKGKGWPRGKSNKKNNKRKNR